MKLNLYPNMWLPVPYGSKDHFKVDRDGMYHFVFSYEVGKEFKKVNFFAAILFENDYYCEQRKVGVENMFEGELQFNKDDVFKIVMKQDSGMLIAPEISRFSIWRELT